jgi:hypothetical protein
MCRGEQGRKVQTRFWWGNFRERDHFDDLGINDRIIV